MIVHLGTDLMMASSIGAVARERGLPFRSVTSAEKLLALLEAEPNVRLALINLQQPDLDISGLGKALAARGTAAPPVVWFAQHVYEDLLQAGTATGLGTVMTRGQLSRELPNLVPAGPPS